MLQEVLYACLVKARKIIAYIGFDIKALNLNHQKGKSSRGFEPSQHEDTRQHRFID